MEMHNLAGQKFGLLTPTHPTPQGGRHGAIWACKCDCGQDVVARADKLKDGTKQSCGCVARDRKLLRDKVGPLTGHPLRRTWDQMRNRCENPRNGRYADYGGRGITVDPRWQSLLQFAADMGPKPTPEHTLDRRDNDGPYSPENCRWATNAEQQANRRDFLLWGEKLTLERTAEKLGVTPDQIRGLSYLSMQQVVDLLATRRA